MNEWISVEDRMPTEGDDVLVFSETDGRMYVAIWTTWGLDLSRSNWITGDEDRILHHVMHWMPLPEGPE